MSDILVRRAEVGEADAAAELLWRVRERNVGSIPPPVHSLDDMRRWMREVVLPSMEVWVAEVPKERETRVQSDARRPAAASLALPLAAAPTTPELVGLMVLKRPDWLEHLYIDAAFTGHGLGARFVELAKQAFSAGLQLWTFQSNVGARRFYERHGFVPVQWTDGDNEEGTPDVRYEWLPT